LIVKPVCCDTSFLFSIYGADIHTSRAVRQANSLGQSLSLTVLNVFEFQNAMRAAQFRGSITSEDADVSLATFEADCSNNKVIVLSTDLNLILNEAKRLRALYTAKHGHRSFDILHVAAALHLNARTFLSFDRNQLRLAEAAGLAVNS